LFGTEVHLDLSKGLTPVLVSEVADACDRTEDVDLLILRLTGGDVWPGAVDLGLVSMWEKALRRLERVAAITVGVWEGPASQAALEVLLTTDHRIADPGAVMIIAGAVEGLWPGVVLHRLAQQIGLAGARRLTLLPGDVSAAELLEAGLLDEVTADLDAAVAAVTKRAAGITGSETAMRRMLLSDAVTVRHEEALGTHLAACDRTLRRSAEPG
jgi:isomerase DpgB